MKPILETSRDPTAPINYDDSPLQMAACQRASSRFRSDVVWGGGRPGVIGDAVDRSALALLSARSRVSRMRMR